MNPHHYYGDDGPQPWDGDAYGYWLAPELELLTTTDSHDEHGWEIRHKGVRVTGGNLAMAPQEFGADSRDWSLRLWTIDGDPLPAHLVDWTREEAGMVCQRIRVARPLSLDECGELGLPLYGTWDLHYTDGAIHWTVHA